MSVEVQVASVTSDANKHPPLRRVSSGVPVPTALGNPTKQQQQTVSSKGITSGNIFELHDSCYSSCSEESHNSLSREPSDSNTKEIAQLSIADPESTTDAETIEQQRILHRNIDFATRLGYSVEQLEKVLEKLGAHAEQEQILSELIKLGRGAMNRGPKVTESNPSGRASPAELRSIVIDGSNIAMTHGRKEVFSCRGICECVQFFRNRGHTDIIVFVPQFRREAPRSDCPITDQHILFDLEKENVLIWTPSRRINGRRIVCHDDRYILKTAEKKDAVIVSNDEYRDLIKENPQYRMLVDERLLMYSFVDGRFMPPDDPLGRHGPKLAQFLSKGNQASSSQLCPYARKCTYGNKCKYYHPERPNGIHVSVTERLTKGRQRRQFLSTCTSQPTANVPESTSHPAIVRTHSLNIPISEKMKFLNGNKKDTKPSLSPHQEEQTQQQPLPSQQKQQPPPPPLPPAAPPPQLSLSNVQQRTTTSLANPQPPAPPPPLLDWSHASLDRHYSAPTNRSPHAVNPRPCLPSAPIIGCNAPATTTIAHYCQSRTAVPSLYYPYPYIGLPSFSGSEPYPSLYQGPSPQQYFIPNPNIINGAYGAQTRPLHMPTPTTTIWGETELNVGPLTRPLESTYPVVNDRLQLQNDLCRLFPKEAVLDVMEAHPDENDPQKLCPRIIMEVQKRFGNTA